jgi:hypothetical protein
MSIAALKLYGETGSGRQLSLINPDNKLKQRKKERDGSHADEGSMSRASSQTRGEIRILLLKCGEKCERFAVSGYRSRQSVKRRGVFKYFASCYLGVRRQFQKSFYGFTCVTRARLPHGPGLLLKTVGPHHRADNMISRVRSSSQRKAMPKMRFAKRTKVSKYDRWYAAPKAGGSRAK